MGRPSSYSNIICMVEGCGRKVRARGICDTHYKRVYRYNQETGLAMSMEQLTAQPVREYPTGTKKTKRVKVVKGYHPQPIEGLIMSEIEKQAGIPPGRIITEEDLVAQGGVMSNRDRLVPEPPAATDLNPLSTKGQQIWAENKIKREQDSQKAKRKKVLLDAISSTSALLSEWCKELSSLEEK